MTKCPICKTPTGRQIEATPYWGCPTCECWFQDPQPPKLYQEPSEYDLAEMPERDKEANRIVAKWLFEQVMKGKPGRTLDIGCKHPVLAASLAAHGCDAFAIDGVMPSSEKNVVTAAYDFESDSDFDILFAERGVFDLITLVHVYEHMYDPLAALRKLRELVKDDGRVYLRLPDHRIPGYERDLTPQHYSIHPYYHCLTSILEALAQVRDCFVVEFTNATGPGQRDIVLRPISTAPTIALAMIVKNEERDLPRCLRSLEPVIDCAFIADTGSTDKTVDVAHGTIAKPVASGWYTAASEQDEAGDWKLWDFSKARNYALENAEACGKDWIMWADADDEIVTPNALRRAAYWPQYDFFGVWIDGGGGSRWIQHRLWKAAKKVRFAGRCHEYAILDGLLGATIDEGLIAHHAEPVAGQEDSNPRNLRMLMRDWEDKHDARTAFYLANTHRDGGRNEEAAKWYQTRLDLGVGYRDEYLFSRLSMARCLRGIDRHADADAVSMESLRLAPDWAEFRMELGYGAYFRKDYAAAMAHALQVPTNAPIPPTELWREHASYRDAAPRLLSWCYEHTGDLSRALDWAHVAKLQIGKPDAEWDARLERLRVSNGGAPTAGPAILSGKKRAVALHRPGAIGDILMTLNLIPAFLDANPDTEVHYFCAERYAQPDTLGRIIGQAGATMAMDAAALPAWRTRYDKVIDLIGYPLAEGYPERPMRQHLLEYFAAEMGIGEGMPSLTLRRPTVADHAPYITVQTRAGWSAYKEWPAERWMEVTDALYDKGIDVVRIDESEGRTLHDSIAVFANARMHIGIDSFCNHLTNYYWTDDSGGRRVPGVILWGSTQSSAAGYSDNWNISKGLSCQPCFRENPQISRMPRDPCKVGSVVYGDMKHRCMTDIRVGEVVEAALAMWEEVK